MVAGEFKQPSLRSLECYLEEDPEMAADSLVMHCDFALSPDIFEQRGMGAHLRSIAMRNSHK